MAENDQTKREQQYLEAYEQYSDAIFRYCYYRVFDREKAKDYTQETYYRTWKYISNGHEVDNIRAFLYKTANHIIIDEFRKKKGVSLDQIMEKGFAPKVDNREKTENYFMGQDIINVIKSLDEKYQEPILLRYVDDLSIKEIANVLHETENNIYVRISRGLQKIKEVFKQQQH